MRATAAALLLLLACALAGGCGGATAAENPGPAAVSRTLRSDGIRRSYAVYRPAGLGRRRVPAVVALGGEPSGPTGFDTLARRHGFVAAYPQRQGAQWHLGCCDAPRRRADDVRFLERVIAELVRRDHVDPARVYLVGFSQAGAMAYRMACERSRLLAGVGSIGGFQYLARPCRPDRPVTIYEMHGDRDYFGGSCGGTTQTNRGCRFGQPGYEPSVRQLNAAWRARNRCGGRGTVAHPTRLITEQTWRCSGPSGVRLDVLKAFGHCWPVPGGCGDFDANARLWSYLSRFRRAAAAAPGSGGSG